MRVIKKGQVARFLFVLAVTITIFIFLFHKIPFKTVLNSIKSAEPGIICLTLLISIIANIFISAYRWKLILKKLNCKVSFKDSLFIKLSSKPILKILPFKIGEFFKIVYLDRLHKVSYSTAIVSIVSEYLLNFITLPIFMSIGALIYLYRAHYITIAQSIFIPAAGLCFFPLISTVKIFRSECPNKFINRVYKVLKKRFKDFRAILKDGKILFCTVSFSLAEFVNVYLLSRAIGILLPAWAILVFMPVVIFVGFFKISFAGMGIREWLITLLFISFASPEKLLAMGILYSSIEHIVPFLIGGLLTGTFLKRILYRKKQWIMLKQVKMI